MFSQLFTGITKYRNTAQEQYKIHAETLRQIEITYAQDMVKKLSDEENRNFQKALEDPRAEAKAVISKEIGKARNYVDYQLSQINCSEMNEIRSLKGLKLSHAEITALQSKYYHSYWSRKALNEVLNELPKPTPQFTDVSPDYTLSVLEKVENDLNFAVDYYDGRPLSDATLESIACDRIMSGIGFAKYADDLNRNPAFTEQRIDDFYKPLTPDQDRQLYRQYFVDCSTDDEKRTMAEKIVKLGHGDMLERSRRFSKYLPAEYLPVTGVEECAW